MQISAAKALVFKFGKEPVKYSKKDLIFISDPFSLVTQYTCLSYLFELTLGTTGFPNTTIFSSQFLINIIIIRFIFI